MPTLRPNRWDLSSLWLPIGRRRRCDKRQPVPRSTLATELDTQLVLDMAFELKIERTGSLLPSFSRVWRRDTKGECMELDPSTGSR